MGDVLTPGLVAFFAGALMGAALLVPAVAVSYRRHGGVSTRRLLLWGAVLVYFWSIWAYTLLPLPDPGAVQCAGVNLRPGAFVGDVREAIGRGGNPLTQPALLQVLLNVVLFVPLGFLMRVLARRGVLVAGLAGLATSVLVETTQRTGVWGAYPCSYRVFDVDDLLVNTLGALAGSVIALAVPARLRGRAQTAEVDQPRPVTRRRRSLGMVCDGLSIYLADSTVGLVVQLWLQYVAQDRAAVLAGSLASTIGAAVGVGAWLVLVLVTGRSIGDHAVRVRFTRGALPEWLARLTRFAAGAGGYVTLTALPTPFSTLALLLALTTLVLLLTTHDGRALPGVIGNRRVVDDRTHVQDRPAKT